MILTMEMHHILEVLDLLEVLDQRIIRLTMSVL
jgi:hypothetical protein